MTIKIVSKKHMKDHWLKYIDQGKVLIKRYSKIQMEIAEIALKACDVRWGGGGHWSNFEHQYTLTKFAKEIGLNKKTLMEWTRIKRQVFDKLSKEQKKKALKSPFQALTKTMYVVNKNSAREDVQKIYNETRHGCLDRRTIAVDDVIKRLRTFKFHDKTGLSTVSINKRLELQEELEKCLKIIKKCNIPRTKLQKARADQSLN